MQQLETPALAPTHTWLSTHTRTHNTRTQTEVTVKLGHHVQRKTPEHTRPQRSTRRDTHAGRRTDKYVQGRQATKAAGKTANENTHSYVR
mmetsp:Transcript_9967/g.24211  ORF Transcript_9967/g.24211 Transcript_9967/m.24211 type:complete len:90 (-) Transcript_9967:362-631(-)